MLLQKAFSIKAFLHALLKRLFVQVHHVAFGMKAFLHVPPKSFSHKSLFTCPSKKAF